MEISFALGKNGGYIPSSLGGRSISVSRQAWLVFEGNVIVRLLSEPFSVFRKP